MQSSIAIPIPEWLQIIRPHSNKKTFLKLYEIWFEVTRNIISERMENDLKDIIPTLKKFQQEKKELLLPGNIVFGLSEDNKMLLSKILTLNREIDDQKLTLSKYQLNKKKETLLVDISALRKNHPKSNDYVLRYIDLLPINTEKFFDIIDSEIRLLKQLALWLLKIPLSNPEYVNNQLQHYFLFNSKGYLTVDLLKTFPAPEKLEMLFDVRDYLKEILPFTSNEILDNILILTKKNHINSSVFEKLLTKKSFDKQNHGIHFYLEHGFGLKLLKYFDSIISSTQKSKSDEKKESKKFDESNILNLLLLKNSSGDNCFKIIFEYGDFNTISYCLDLISNFFLENVEELVLKKFRNSLLKNKNFLQDQSGLTDLFYQIAELACAALSENKAVSFYDVDMYMKEGSIFFHPKTKNPPVKTQSDLTNSRQAKPQRKLTF